MKVITEEVLRKILKRHFGDDLTNQSLASHLANELQELDTLTVTRLRPMSEAPKIPEGKYLVFVLMFFENMGVPLIRGFEMHKGFDERDVKGAIGWIPIPKYEPEATK